MAENFKEKWQAVREKGIMRFIIKEGVITGLIYGIIAVALVFLIDSFIVKSTQGFDINRGLLGFVLVFGANIAASIIIWFLNEKKFKK